MNQQEWHYGSQYGDTGFYQWINAEGKCLGVAGGSTQDGAQVIEFTCNGGASQAWSNYFTSGNSYEEYVFNYNSGDVLKPTSNSNDAYVKQENWGGPNNLDQLWVHVDDSDSQAHKQ